MTSDTAPNALRVQVELLRRAGPERRGQMASDLTARVFAASLEGLRRRRPGLSELERRLLLRSELHGAGAAAGVAARLRGEAPR